MALEQHGAGNQRQDAIFSKKGIKPICTIRNPGMRLFFLERRFGPLFQNFLRQPYRWRAAGYMYGKNTSISNRANTECSLKKRRFGAMGLHSSEHPLPSAWQRFLQVLQRDDRHYQSSRRYRARRAFANRRM